MSPVLIEYNGKVYLRCVFSSDTRIVDAPGRVGGIGVLWCGGTNGGGSVKLLEAVCDRTV